MDLAQKRILTMLRAVESAHRMTQRSLAKQLGVSLGTTNSMVQNLVSRGLLKQFDGESRYHLTPAGNREKLRLVDLEFQGAVGDYTEIRDQILRNFLNLSSDQRRITFYGVGVVAEIAYLVVTSNGFELLGVVDETKVGKQFFEHKVAHPSQLKSGLMDGTPFDCVVVTSYKRSAEIQRNLQRMNFDNSKVVTLFTSFSEPVSE
jgi:DNA-binding MarR family transcriptional regulator